MSVRSAPAALISGLAPRPKSRVPIPAVAAVGPEARRGWALRPQPEARPTGWAGSLGRRRASVVGAGGISAGMAGINPPRPGAAEDSPSAPDRRGLRLLLQAPKEPEAPKPRPQSRFRAYLSSASQRGFNAQARPGLPVRGLAGNEPSIYAKPLRKASPQV